LFINIITTNICTAIEIQFDQLQQINTMVEANVGFGRLLNGFEHFDKEEGCLGLYIFPQKLEINLDKFLVIFKLVGHLYNW